MLLSPAPPTGFRRLRMRTSRRAEWTNSGWRFDVRLRGLPRDVVTLGIRLIEALENATHRFKTLSQCVREAFHGRSFVERRRRAMNCSISAVRFAVP